MRQTLNAWNSLEWETLQLGWDEATGRLYVKKGLDKAVAMDFKTFCSYYSESSPKSPFIRFYERSDWYGFAGTPAYTREDGKPLQRPEAIIRKSPANAGDF